VANNGSGNVTEIDGASNNSTTVAARTNPISVAVNPATNKAMIGIEGVPRFLCSPISLAS
jgi:hypothetical protein